MRTKKIKLLMFEQDPYLANMYLMKLQENGFRTKRYKIVLENLADKVAKEKPDIISTRIVMPKSDGLITTRILKEDPRTKDIPIIGLENLGQEYKKKALEVGMEKYLIMAHITAQIYVDNVIKILKKKGIEFPIQEN